jgi:hypothetical protein
MTEGNGEKITQARFQGMMIERTGDILRRLTDLENKVDCNVVDVATLKIKAGFWGFLAGAVPSLIAVLVMIFKDKP